MKESSKKTVAKASSLIYKIRKWIFRLYILPTATLGTLMIFIVFSGWGYSKTIPETMSVPLENGFIYATNPKNGRHDKVLIDKNSTLIVDGSIRSLMIHNKIVYGYRDPVLSDEQLYFICTYGEDCSKTQDYNDVEFKLLLKEKSLPPFIGNNVKTRRSLTIKEFLKRIITLNWQWR